MSMVRMLVEVVKQIRETYNRMDLLVRLKRLCEHTWIRLNS